MKLFRTTLAILFLLSSLIACSNVNNSKKANGNSSSDNTKSELNIVNGKIEPAVTITTVRGEDPTVKFKNGETYDDNVHTRWAEEKLGVKLQNLWTSPVADGSFDTKLKLMLTAGDELPDIFLSTQANTTNMFLESGKVLDVEEAFEKYASPTWKAAMNEATNPWYPFIRDGKKYAIPYITNTMGTQSALWIRQDWLDKLGLKAPTTLEELETVMDAFVNQDPDGNGKKDTVALDFGMKDAFDGYPIGDTSWIFGLFGAIPEIWYPGKDGKLQYGSIQPEIKDALAKIKEWKDKGYIRNEIALNDFNKVSENVAAGKVGMLGGENWLMDYPGSLMLANNPKAWYTPYPLPKGVNGKNMRTVKSPSKSGAILISKDISEESLQAFFHYMNALYEKFNNDDPFYFKEWQEGYDYVIKDNKVVLDESQIPGGMVYTPKYTLLGNDVSYQSKESELAIRIGKGEPLTNKDFVDPNNPIVMVHHYARYVIMSQTDFDVPNYFQGPATPTMSSRKELLHKQQMDTFTDIIYGKQPLKEFDSFVEKWKKSGGTDITKEVNEWYKSVKEVE